MAKRGKKTSVRGVRTLGDGRYLIRAWATDPKTGKQKEMERQILAGSVGEAAAEKARLRAEYLRARTPHQPAARARLADAAPRWIREQRSRWKPSTQSIYATNLDHWIDVFPDHYLDAIEPHEVTAALERWRAEGAAADTVNGRLRVLRTFARECKVPAMVEGVRAVARTVHEDESAEEEGKGLSLEELRAFLAAGPDAAGPAWWPLLACAAWTGCRFGELSALEWRDLDLDAGTLRIRRAVWRGIVGHPKARSSARDIVLASDVVGVLRAHRARQVRGDEAPQIEVAGETPPAPATGLVFPSPKTGGYASNTGARFAALRVYRAAKIELDGRPVLHAFRHSINNALRQVASELVRQSLIGHADEAIGRRYSKVSIEEKRAAVGAVVRLVRGTGST